MMRLAIGVCAFVVAGRVCAADRMDLPVNGRFVLAPSIAAEAFKQCSRSREMPLKNLKYWRPKDEDISRLEGLLESSLNEIERKGLPVPPKLSYHRQYVGFETNGKRYIYGNFYRMDFAQLLDDEARNPVITCDGGPAFWGIVFRMDTNAFEELRFNGHPSPAR